ncbi:CAP domain-containing protein [Mrakia frigida]|uniref:CAP domain-containing protein n=1 Tax=Mrakia frigida TaxID=29902 RepID=UPI003FCC1D8D
MLLLPSSLILLLAGSSSLAAAAHSPRRRHSSSSLKQRAVAPWVCSTITRVGSDQGGLKWVGCEGELPSKAVASSSSVSSFVPESTSVYEEPAPTTTTTQEEVAPPVETTEAAQQAEEVQAQAETTPDPTPEPTPSPDPTTAFVAEPTFTPEPIVAAAVDTSSSSSSSSDEQNRYLAAHNSFRAQYGAGALSWSEDAASAARSWAGRCVFEHSGGAVGSFGENLAAGTGSGYSIESAIKSWTDEAKDYNPSAPNFSHFTQVVWKGTTQLGCAMVECDGIFDASFGKAKYHVCEYSSPGNVAGQFGTNVGSLA